MMSLGNIVEVNREQRQDRLRQAEQARLIKQVESASSKPGLWQYLSHLIVGIDRPNQLAKKSLQGREVVHLA